MANQALDNLTQEVSETTTVIDSAITLITGLKTKLDEAIASKDWEAVQALSANLNTSQDALAAAITANTPAEEA